MFPTAQVRARRLSRTRMLRAVVAGFVLIAQFVVYSQVVQQPNASAGPAIAQTYYTPFEAQQYIDLLRTISGDPGCCSTSVISTISVTSGANGNTVYYDHFEDGYEADPTSPSQASTLTLSLDAGDVWTSSSTIDIDPRASGNYFDGRDKIVSIAPIAVTQAAYASDPGTVHAGAVQVLDLDKSGLRFDVPAGQNANFNEAFDYVGLVIIATRDLTTVNIDADANGSFEISVTLDEGETHVVDGGVNLGAVVTADKPVSSYVATGDVGATYEGRLIELYPTSIWSNDMISPVGSYSAAQGSRVFLFNPGATAITVDILIGGGGTATLTVPARSQGNYLMPTNHGARFTSQGGEPFYGFQAISTEGTDTAAYDWGFTLVPATAATPSVIVPYGPGSAGLTNNYSPVWVAANATTTLYVDLDGDPAVGPLTDPQGNKYDFSCAAAAYESLTVYADGTTNCYLPSQSAATGGDRDMTGARIYSLEGARLSAAWGQRPNYVAGSPALDMGTTILPFPELLMRKSSVLSNDVDGDGLADGGDEIEYTLEMQNLGIVDVTGVLAQDETPDPTAYVSNSTTLDGVAQSDDSSPFSPTPLDSDSPAGGLSVGTIPPGGVRTVTFKVVVDDPIPFGILEVANFAVMTSNIGSTTATDRRPLDVPPLQILKDSTPTYSPVSSDDTITYTIRVFNADASSQTGVAVTDTLPAGVTYVPGSVAATVDGGPVTATAPPNLVSGVTLASGSTLVITFDVDVDAPISAATTEFTNFAEASSTEYPTPVSDTAVDPAGPVVDLSLDKIDDETAPLSPGDRLVYTLTVANAGPDDAHDVVVVDTLPSEVTFVAAASDPSCLESPVGTITCSLGDLGVTSTSFDIAVDVNAGVDGTFTNSAVVSSSSPEGNPGNESAFEDTVTDSPPTLIVTKTPSPGSVPEPGATVTFAVTVENTSVEAVTLTALVDDVFGDLLDSGNLSVSSNTCSAVATSIAIGGTLACSFDAFIAGDGADPAHANTVTATVEDDEANSQQASDQASVTFVDVAPTISVTKTPSSGSVSEPGGTVTFAVLVENLSSESVTLTALSDDVFGDLLDPANPEVSANTCASVSTSIGIGGTLSCSFDAFVAGNAGDPAHLDTVTATVTDNEGTTGQDSDQASVAFDDVAPTIDVSKNATPGSVPEPGATVTFSVQVQNTTVEPVTLTALVDDVFGDLLDPANPNVSANACASVSTSIGIGGALSCSFDAFVAGDAGDPAHVDTVTATVQDDDGSTGQDSDQALVTFSDVPPSVSVSKTPAPGSVPEPGGTVTFSIDVANTSVEVVTVTALFDDVYGDLLNPANPNVSANTCASVSTTIAIGGTLSCSFDGYVAGLAGGPDHVNTASAIVMDNEGTTGQGSDQATVVFGDSTPTISVTKNSNPGSIAEPGGVVTFSVSVDNTSVEEVTLASLVDDVFGDLLDAANPAVANNTCPAQSTVLSVGATLLCSFEASVAGHFGDPDHLDTVTATVTDGEGNSVSDYDSATVRFLDVLPSVAVTKSPSVSSLDEPGGPVSFDLLLTNWSVEEVLVVGLSDDVFGDLLDPLNPNVVNNTCEYLPAVFGVGGTFACSFDGLVIGDASGPDHENTVTFEVEDGDGNFVSDTDVATVGFDDVVPTATVTKTPSVGSAIEPGATVTFSVSITNTTVESLTIDAIDDDVFGDLLDPANPAVTANTCDGMAATIEPDETLVCQFQAFLAGYYGDPDHVNTVTVTLSDDDGNTITPSDDAAVAFGPANSNVVGLVFEDLDLDGIRDNGEVGIPGVDVIITEAGGSPTVVTTAADGSWTVAVLPGAVTIEVDGSTVPAGYLLTTANATQVVGAMVDQDVAADDIGYGPPGGSLSGTVFMDLDGDPNHDAYEPTFEGITVTLLDSEGLVAASVETDQDGFYEFGGVPVDTYTVVVDGTAVGTGFVGSVDPDGIVNDETIVVIGSGSAVVGIDFGYTGTASVGDTVWIDQNEDGVVDVGEQRLPGAIVTLVWAGPDGTLATADDYDFDTRESDDDGWYLFSGLPDGLYRLEVAIDDVPLIVTPTTNTQITTLLGPGQAFVLADFGFSTEGQLPFTGLDAEHLMLAAGLLMALSGLVLADGHKRERRFQLAINRLEE